MSSSDLPLALRFSWWGTAWLRGVLSPDGLMDGLLGSDAAIRIGADPVLPGLAALRAAGATAFGAAFPVQGDPVGLGGPKAFNTAALEAGEAVVVVGADLGLVPDRTGAAVDWMIHPAHRRQLSDVGEADRTLRTTLLESAGRLADLDVARWRPDVADALLDLRRRPAYAAPPAIPARCVDLAARALQALDIVDLALADDGGALSAGEARERRQALLPLAAAGRRALVAAGSPEAWPE